jgi:hypothetical protein
MESHREVERSQGLRVEPAAIAQWLAAASRKASSARSKGRKRAHEEIREATWAINLGLATDLQARNKVETAPWR